MRRTIFDSQVSLVELMLDPVTSAGDMGLPLIPSNARPSALKVSECNVWFGFLINDRTVKRVDPGQSLECLISFYNHEEAVSAFPEGASVLFGDGAVTRGVIRVRHHNVDALSLRR